MRDVMEALAELQADTEPRPPTCECQWEAGDSPCPVHGEDEVALEERNAVCGTCGRSVTETLDTALVDFSDGTGGPLGVWRAERHDAPCGLPCLGGGVSMRAMRRDENGVRWVHRSGRYGCPRCAPTPPTEWEGG